MALEEPTSLGHFTSDPDERIIVDRIYDAVMERRLGPKTKLSEGKLCETFGVGRMRVRRALLLLSSQGIVDLHSNRGAYIACPSAKEAEEVFEARLAIEPSLVRTITNTVNKKDLKNLIMHIDMENHARNNSERTEIIRLSGEFHVKLALASRNSVLIRIIRELVTRTSLIVELFGDAGNSCCPDNEHAEILNAIKTSDAKTAGHMVSQHLRHIQESLDLSVVKPEPFDLKEILGTK